MSAQIIPFPSNIQYSIYAHWSGLNQHVFDAMIRDGYSVKEAAQRIEDQIRDENDAESLPSKDRLLFLARRALSRMKSLND